MSITIYGIPNCTSVKKARLWLEEHGIAYHFHDYRADGLPEQNLKRWCAALGWEMVISKRSNGWKALPEEARANMDARRAITAALETPTMVRRPVLEMPDAAHIGFSAKLYADIFREVTEA